MNHSHQSIEPDEADEFGPVVRISRRSSYDPHPSQLYVPPSTDITVYATGRMDTDPGPGAIAIRVATPFANISFVQYHPEITRSAMDFMLPFYAFDHILKLPGSVLIHTPDSDISRRLSDGTADRWAVNGWRDENGKRVENHEMWMILFDLRGIRPGAPVWFTSKVDHGMKLCLKAADRAWKKQKPTTGRCRRIRIHNLQNATAQIA